MSSIKKRNQSMSTSASIVGLGRTEAYSGSGIMLSKMCLGLHVTIGKHLEMYIFHLVKNGNRSDA